MTINYYPEAIRILTDDKADWRELAIAFAQVDPAGFVTIAKSLGMAARMRPAYPNIVQMMKDGNKVGAVKELRNCHGLGLADAKYILDHLQHAMYLAGKCPNDYRDAPVLTSANAAILADLKYVAGV